MKTFQEFIVEGRDAPLYHSTGLRQAAMILRENRLKARQFHPGEYRHYMDKTTQDTKLNKTHEHLHDMDATSLTRSLQFALDWRMNGIVFEVNQRKLAQTHKIVPYNYFMKAARTSPTKDSFSNQMEEAVIGSVENFSNYIIKIIVETKGLYDMVCNDKLYHIIASHPKLYLLYDKRFANEDLGHPIAMPHVRKSIPFV